MSIFEFIKNIFPVYSFIISGIIFGEINFILYFIYFILVLIFIFIYRLKNKIVNKAFTIKIFLRIKRIFYINKNLILSSVPSILINTLTLNIPILLTGQYYGKSNAGFLYNSCRLLNGPIQVLANPIRNVFYKKLSNIYNLKNQRIILKLFYKYFAYCVLVSIISYGLIHLLFFYIDHDIIHENIVRYANVIIPFFIVKFIVFSTSNITLVYRKELWVLCWNVLYFLVLSSILYYLGTTNYSLYFWLSTYSVLSISFYTILWVFHLRLIFNRSNV